VVQEPPLLHAKTRRRNFGGEQLLWLGLLDALLAVPVGHQPKDPSIKLGVQVPKLPAKIHQGLQRETIDQTEVVHHLVE